MKLHNLLKLSLLFFILFMSLYSFSVKAVTIEDILDGEDDIAKQHQYNLDLNSPFSKEKNGFNEVIDPETGNMKLALKLISHPVSEELNCDVTLVYNSDNAKAKKIICGYNYYQGYLYLKKRSLTRHEARGSFISTGIGLKIPYVEKSGSSYYLHLENGEIYLADSTSVSGLSGLDFKNMKFTECSGADGSENGDTKFKLSVYGGLTYEFRADGLLTRKSDRFGNNIEYKWISDKYYDKISSIIPSSGQKIDFSYSSNDITISYGEKRYFLKTEYDAAADTLLLKKIIYPEGSAAELSYKQIDLKSQLIKDSPVFTMQYYPIETIKYRSGLKTHYEYGYGTRNIGSGGYEQYIKLSKRYDSEKSNPQTRLLSYIYDGEPDGYPSYSYSTLPDDYKYSSSVTDGNGMRLHYFYSNDHKMTEKHTYAGTKVIMTEKYLYSDKNSSPLKTETRRYNDAGESYVVYTDTEYDEYCNLISESTYSGLDNTEDKQNYTRTYKYSSSSGLLCSSSYKKDSTSKIEIKNILSDDDNNIIQSLVLENGKKVRNILYEYDAWGRVTKQKTETSEGVFGIQSFVYADSMNFPLPTAVTAENVRRADGKTENVVLQKLQYDVYGNTVLSTDGCGNSTQYVYDLLDRPVKVILPDGAEQRYDYDDALGKIVYHDPESGKYIYNFSESGLPTGISDGVTGELLEKREYDNCDRISCITDALGGRLEYFYNDRGETVQKSFRDVSGKLLYNISYIYNQAYRGGTYLKIVQGGNENGIDGGSGNELMSTAEYQFDFRGYLLERKDRGDDGIRVTKYAYDFAGNNTKTVSPSGIETFYKYDGAGNLLETTVGNLTVRAEYDLGGRKIADYNGENEKISYEYDSMGRMIRTLSPYNGKTKCESTFVYDGCGKVIKQTDGEGRITLTEYNGRGLPVRVAAGNGADETLVALYEYDKAARVVSASFGDGKAKYRTTRYDYDHRGQNISVTDALGQKTQYFYDSAGNLVETVDRNGISVYTEYDGLQRPVKQTNSKDTGTISLSYDLLGRTVKAERDGIITRFEYNAYGELTSETRGAFSKHYGYNADGALKQFKLLYGGIAEQELEYCYNEQGLLSEVSTPAGTQKYEYDKAGRLVTGENFATGINTAYTYYPSGAVKSIVLTGSGGEMLDGLWYEYDKSGNKLLQFENDVETKYTYDSLNRLKREQKGDIHTEYYYDAYNNISEKLDIIAAEPSAAFSLSTRYRYDACNRLVMTESESEASVSVYGYDANGNLTSVKNGSDERYYGYNGFGEMTLAAVGDKIANYEYDYAGLRIGKTVDGKHTKFINNGDSVIAELSEGQLTNYYCGISLIGFEQNDEYYYYKLNAHGDTIGILNGLGEQIKSYTYDAFGNEQTPDKFDTNPFRYCGEYFDNETGLIYLRARYYDPSIQRFLSEDTHWNPDNMIYGDKGYYQIDYAAVIQSSNLLVYCGNNPIIRRDTGGEFWETVFDAISLAWSIADVIKDPTDGWAWLGLAGDLVDFVPFLTGVGESVRAVGIANKASKVDDVVDSLKALKTADRIKAIKNGRVILPYKHLKKLTKDTGLEAHHLVEKRFAKAIGMNENDIISIAIDTETHQKITNAMRKSIGYVGDKKDIITSNAKAQDVWNATKEVYSEMGMIEYLEPIKQMLIDAGNKLKW